MLSKSYLFLAVYCIVMIHISCWVTTLEVSVVRVGCSIEYRQKLRTSCIEIRKNEFIWSSWVVILTINLIGWNKNTSRLSAMKCYAIRDLTATWKQWYSCPEELHVYLVQFTWNIMKDWGSDTNHSGGLHHVLWTETCDVNCGQSGGVTKVLLFTNTYTYELSVWWFVLILSELEKSHLQPLHSVCWNVFSMKIIQQDLMELLM